jgi:ATP-binding cassette subfamily C protein CydC
LLALLRPYWLLMMGAALLGAGTILANVGLLATSAVLIAEAALQPLLFDLMLLIVGVRFFGIARAVLRYAERYTTHDVTFRILKKIRVHFYRRLVPLVPEGIAGRADAELFRGITADIETLQFFYIRVLAAPFIMLLVLLSCAGFLAFFSVPAALVLIAMYILAGVLCPVLLRKMTRGLATAQATLQDAFYNKVLDFTQGLADLAAAGAVQSAKAEIWELLSAAVRLRRKIEGLDSLTQVLLRAASYLTMLLALYVTAPLVYAGELSGVFLALVALVTQSSFEALNPMPLVLEQLEEGLVAAERLFAVIGEAEEREPEFAQREIGESQDARVPNPQESSLSVENLTFNYPGGPEVLRGLGFSLAKGAKLAIVGDNGAGKSTLVQILLKLRTYRQGSIRLEGRELRDIPESEVREQIAVLNQDTYIFHTSLRENVLIAKPAATEAEVAEAWRRAGLTEFIASLPEGEETTAGEGGFMLSGGQRQRLALARLFLRDCPLVILDEADQGLDAVTAADLRRELRLWTEGRSLITITHSLHGLADMDEILVLSGGQVVERGRQAELLARGGHYAHLFSFLTK